MGDRGPETRVEDSDIIGVVRGLTSSTNPVVTTEEIVAELPIGKRMTQKRLKDLAREKKISRKEVGSGYVWWAPNVVDISDLEIPGRGGYKRDLRREAVRSAYELLKKNRYVSAEQLADAAWETDSETYESKQSLWNNAVRPALKQLPFVEAVQRGKWAYTGGKNLLNA